MNQSFAFIIAWPETHVRKVDTWYDPIMTSLGFCNDNYYKVGHAAIVLIDGETGKPHYFDFGRYQTPKGKGRVRDASSDKDLVLHSIINYENGIPQLEEMICELNSNAACQGSGLLRGGLHKINFYKAYDMAKSMQLNGTIPYGPFVVNGTNCARFVRTIAMSGSTSLIQMSKLLIAPMITPTPMWNVRAVGEYRLCSESVVINF
ncbi:MAG: hypothetical protein MK105_02075 [Crocinitomicaceae bacterium]|nr:hypothetical protein [Crocinitomicaceae bacterium]